MAFNIQKHNLTANMEIVFIYFLLLQPALDVLAYMNVSLSTPLRGFAMVAGAAYILFLPQTKVKKSVLIYLVTLGLFMMVHLLNNYMIKEPFSLSLEITYIIKTIFFIVLLLVYIFVITSFSKRKNWQKILQLSVLVNMTFIAVIMLLANLTGTGHRSYGALAKEGHSGWFFSGNELSVILGMGFSIVILYMLQRKSTSSKMLILPVIGLVIWAMLTVGTKVSFGSVIIVLGISLLVFIVKALYNKKNWLNVTFLSVILTITVLITPFTPIGNNLDLTFGTNIANQDSSLADIDNPDVGKQATQQLLSGREDFLNEIKSQYEKAPVSQQLLGMGFGGNYTESPKLIEMDFLDWYFNFGLVGFFLLLLPLFYIGYSIISNIIKNHLRKINVSIVLIAVSVCLGFGSAFVAGHVLSSPAVSIYLAVLTSYLFTLAQQKPPA